MANLPSDPNTLLAMYQQDLITRDELREAMGLGPFPTDPPAPDQPPAQTKGK